MSPCFRQETRLPRPLEEVFPFFADPANLGDITPDWLDFRILPPVPAVIHAGTTIDYRLRVHGIPLRWTSRITLWEPPHRFIDEQIRGPYRRWVHEHLFRELAGETLVGDVVHYEVPGGALVDRLFVRRDIERIFGFRERKLRERFA